MRLDFEDGVRRLNDGGIRTAADGVFISRGYMRAVSPPSKIAALSEYATMVPSG